LVSPELLTSGQKGLPDDLEGELNVSRQVVLARHLAEIGARELGKDHRRSGDQEIFGFS
jgi:hypothetical protein